MRSLVRLLRVVGFALLVAGRFEPADEYTLASHLVVLAAGLVEAWCTSPTALPAIAVSLLLVLAAIVSIVTAVVVELGRVLVTAMFGGVVHGLRTTAHAAKVGIEFTTWMLLVCAAGVCLLVGLLFARAHLAP